MSLNLLTSYGSDNDSDDSETFVTSSDVVQQDLADDNAPTVDAADDGNYKAPAPSEKSSFFVDENDLSSDEDADDRPATVTPNTDEPPVKKRLPSVAGLLKSKRIGSSVFVSEQQREENLHNATLSQHVALSEQQKPSGKSKQICKAFKRGECRRGNTCRFTHPAAADTPQTSGATLKGTANMYTTTDVIFNKKMK